ncbi:MAG: hypothetical protein NVS3B13_39050 [Mucilaginibacter sp.]
MDLTGNFWRRINIHDWFLTDEKYDNSPKTDALTAEDIYAYIVEKFNSSIKELSFGNRIIFYHEYVVIFNIKNYQDFTTNKKGLLGLIIQECVKKFYELLNEYRLQNKVVEPSSSKWVFRLVTQSDYAEGDLGFIGKLLPDGNQQKENLKVTFIPRQTGIAETYDVNQNILNNFNYYSDGYYEIPYNGNLAYNPVNVQQGGNGIYARLETTVPENEFKGHKIDYLIKDEEVVISGNEEKSKESNVFRIPTEWVNSPHLRIRYNNKDSKFYLASFGEKTFVNENEIVRSAIDEPIWMELPLNSKILLNGIVGINIYKS